MIDQNQPLELSRIDVYPYDGEWDKETGALLPVPHADEWHYRAARAVLYDNCDRREIKWGFRHIDLEIRRQIVAAQAALIKAAYEAARPKSTPITGLPEALPDGTRIVGWRWGMTGPGDWHVSPVSDTLLEANLGGFLRVIAITETDNG